ncbi:MAG: hypothetical protein JW860_02145 [Sedimentisphaerales bacterium]|nr:hypothetical protein [Sedimentisphaerales bacterium]
MTKRAIGIDINSDKMIAVQMARRGDTLCLEKTCTRPSRREEDTPSEFIANLFTQHGFDRRAAAALAMPHNQIFFKTTDSSAPEQDKISDNPDSPYQNDFPVLSDQRLLDFGSDRQLDNKHKSLVTATSQSSLKELLETTRVSGFRYELIEAPVFALVAAVKTNHPDITADYAIIIFSDSSHVIITITHKNEIITVRNIPQWDTPPAENQNEHNNYDNLIREIEMTWRSEMGRKIPDNTPLVLAGQHTTSPQLRNILRDNLNCQIILYDPLVHIQCNDNKHIEPEICIAQGLSLRYLHPEKYPGANFIHTLKKDSRKCVNAKTQKYLGLFLITTIALVYLTGLLIQKNRLEGQYQKIKNEIKQTFHQALPQEKNIVNELAQLDAALASQRKAFDLFEASAINSVKPLDILHTISAHTPEQLNLRINNILITQQAAQLSGQCASSTIAYKWQRILQEIPGFDNVNVSGLEKLPDSDEVQFSVSLTLKSTY